MRTSDTETPDQRIPASIPRRKKLPCRKRFSHVSRPNHPKEISDFLHSLITFFFVSFTELFVNIFELFFHFTERHLDRQIFWSLSGIDFYKFSHFFSYITMSSFQLVLSLEFLTSDSFLCLGNTKKIRCQLRTPHII